MTSGQENPDPEANRAAGADDERISSMTTTFDQPVGASKASRISPLLATLGSAVLLGGFFAMEFGSAGFSVDDDLSVDQMVAKLDELGGALSLGGGFQALVAMGVVIFGACVRRALAAREPEGSITPAVALGGAILAASLQTVGAAVTQLAGYFEKSADPAVRLTLYSLAENVFAGAWCPLALTAGAVAFAGLARGSVPRWFGGVSAFIAILLVVAQLVVPWAGWFPALIWIAVASFSLRLPRSASPAVA
jgi:hypothetical protein